jgi:hypothetical protein
VYPLHLDARFSSPPGMRFTESIKLVDSSHNPSGTDTRSLHISGAGANLTDVLDLLNRRDEQLLSPLDAANPCAFLMSSGTPTAIDQPKPPICRNRPG